eukprot:3397618-Amphidinium_carterae.1
MIVLRTVARFRGFVHYGSVQKVAVQIWEREKQKPTTNNTAKNESVESLCGFWLTIGGAIPPG